VVQSGTATFGNGTVTNVWLTVTNGGDLEVAGFLYMNGPLINSAVINVTNGYSIQTYNSGTAALAGGLVNLATGVIDLWNNSSLYGFTHGNEYLLNQGAINLMSGSAQSTIDFSFFDNAGTLSARHGTLLLQSTHGTLESAETLGVVLNSASDYGKFSIVGAAPLNGILSVSLGNGYVPPVGASFSVVSYGSLSSAFTGFNFPALPHAGVWKPTYGSLALTLQVQPGYNFVSSGTNLVFSVDGLPGHKAILLTSTNAALPLTVWTPLSTNTLDGTGHVNLTNNVVRTEPQRFFIFNLP
jgi:hypothetical protein